MFNIGISELIIVFLAIFLLFGPEALPQIAKEIGSFLAKLKKSIEEIKNDTDHQPK
ncbi:MAG: twin-arginine translocase TatA/TatE family subunit [Candidatus Omnitrophica bacterium]|nr:twin-arginine translocase TatA/TatE family subunit [Candidatus Omnitrophota bacterium]